MAFIDGHGLYRGALIWHGICWLWDHKRPCFMADIVKIDGTDTDDFCTQIAENTRSDTYSEKRQIMA